MDVQKQWAWMHLRVAYRYKPMNSYVNSPMQLLSAERYSSTVVYTHLTSCRQNTWRRHVRQCHTMSMFTPTFRLCQMFCYSLDLRASFQTSIQTTRTEIKSPHQVLTRSWVFSGTSNSLWYMKPSSNAQIASLAALEKYSQREIILS